MDTMLTYNTNSKTGPVCGGRAPYTLSFTTGRCQRMSDTSLLYWISKLFNDYDHHYGVNVYVSHLYDCGDVLLNQPVFYPAHCDDVYLL